MPNNLEAFNPRMLAAYIQDPLHKALVARDICSTQLERELTYGHTVDIARVGSLVANDYVDATGVTPQDIAPAEDTLIVNIWKETTFDVSKKDMKQNKHSSAMEYGKEASYALHDSLDSRILQEAQNAATVNTFGAVTAANVVSLFTGARKGLREQNVRDNGDFCAVVDANILQILEEKLVNVGFNSADAMIKNGTVGSFMGWELKFSNNLYNDGTDDYALFMKKGAVDLVVQTEPDVEERERISATGKTQLGKRFVADLLAGVKTTTQGAKMMYTQKVQ